MAIRNEQQLGALIGSRGAGLGWGGRLLVGGLLGRFSGVRASQGCISWSLPGEPCSRDRYQVQSLVLGAECRGGCVQPPGEATDLTFLPF